MALGGIWQPAWEDQVKPNDGFHPVVTAELMDTNHLPFKLQAGEMGCTELEGHQTDESEIPTHQKVYTPTQSGSIFLNWLQ